MDIEKVLKNLKRRGFLPAYFESGKKAAGYVCSLIPAGESVGSGGSMTIASLGILERLAEGGHKVYAHSLVPESERGNVYQKAGGADWYITSANAVTEGGEIVNIDGAANRVSALCFGVKKIIYIIGVNKITPALGEAIDRAKNIAAPLNAKRLNKKTPCTVTGRCSDCNSPDCICNVTTITHHPTKYQTEVHVVIAGENLGY